MDILAVDDNRVTAFLVEEIIRGLGQNAVIAHSGAEALAALRTRRPDLCIFDWELPDCTGLDLLAEARALRGNRRCHIIMLTARTNPQDEVRAIELGVNEFLTKPVTPRELRARIAAAVARMAGRCGPQPAGGGGDPLDHPAMPPEGLEPSTR